MYTITVLPENRILQAQAGVTLHALLAGEGLIDAPCGGQGTCGKCRVLADGREVPACQMVVDRDMTVTLPPETGLPLPAPRAGRYLAFDVGTTTLTIRMLDRLGDPVASASVRNPQVGFGADVVSRIRAANAGHRETMTRQIRSAMTALIWKLCADPGEIETVCVVGNPAMQQLFLGLELTNLAQIPFEPVLREPEITVCAPVLPVCPNARLITVPDIAGFVGADTVAAVLACGMHDSEELTLLVDIGTNAEMVLGNCHGMAACAAAAGPALEGANISRGMRAGKGAIGRVWIENGRLCCDREEEPVGICGSGLIDAVACALDLGLLNRRGRIRAPDRKIPITDRVVLTQADIRQVQLAKGAIRAGIGLMTQSMGLTFGDIQKVVLTGTFGVAIAPGSACRIGLLPDELLPKITAVGNGAGEGAARLAADPGGLEVTRRILEMTRYLDLSGHPGFPGAFARGMNFREDWLAVAKSHGFTHAVPLEPGYLEVREDVRVMCQADKCGAYGKNWTCPPHCGTLEDCQEKILGYRYGILLQTVGQLRKDIDSRGYRETEQRHLEHFAAFCEVLRRSYPDALCLGSGGCRICKTCAYPEPCRFPERAMSSMEGYGLFVTKVCRDCGAEYHHGPRTITYTACVLFG